MPGATAGVHTLLINNKLITDTEEIEKHLKDHWENTFKKKDSSKAAKDNLGKWLKDATERPDHEELKGLLKKEKDLLPFDEFWKAKDLDP